MDVTVGHELVILSSPKQPVQVPSPQMSFSTISMKKTLIKGFVAIQLPFLKYLGLLVFLWVFFLHSCALTKFKLQKYSIGFSKKRRNAELLKVLLRVERQHFSSPDHSLHSAEVLTLPTEALGKRKHGKDDGSSP